MTGMGVDLSRDAYEREQYLNQFLDPWYRTWEELGDVITVRQAVVGMGVESHLFLEEAFWRDDVDQVLFQELQSNALRAQRQATQMPTYVDAAID